MSPFKWNMTQPSRMLVAGSSSFLSHLHFRGHLHFWVIYIFGVVFIYRGCLQFWGNLRLLCHLPLMCHFHFWLRLYSWGCLNFGGCLDFFGLFQFSGCLLISYFFVIQKSTAPKNGEEFCHGCIGAIRSSLATVCNILRRFVFGHHTYTTCAI